MDYEILSVYIQGTGPFDFIITKDKSFSAIKDTIFEKFHISGENTGRKFKATHNGRDYYTSSVNISGIEIADNYFPEVTMVLAQFNTKEIFGFFGSDFLDKINFSCDKQTGKIIFEDSIDYSQFR